MLKGIVIADAGPIFSLAIVKKLDILSSLFDQIRIPVAVWAEITTKQDTPFYSEIVVFFEERVASLERFNDLTFTLGKGEAESILLYKELEADYLLIDDKKARTLAENFGIQCIGTIGILVAGQEKGLIDQLRPLFKLLIGNKRYYSEALLNKVLQEKGELPL